MLPPQVWKAFFLCCFLILTPNRFFTAESTGSSIMFSYRNRNHICSDCPHWTRLALLGVKVQPGDNKKLISSDSTPFELYTLNTYLFPCVTSKLKFVARLRRAECFCSFISQRGGELLHVLDVMSGSWQLLCVAELLLWALERRYSLFGLNTEL